MNGAKRIAVAGGTGTLGSQVVEVLGERGHEVVAMSRGSGVDLISGEGLGEALAGVETIVDAAGGPLEEDAGTRFFTTAQGNLQRSGAERGVTAMVVVSIIGVDHVAGGYYAAKRAQERAAVDGPLATRILRSAEFHEYVGQMVGWNRDGDLVRLPTMRVQLVAARSVAEAIADLVEGEEDAPPGSPIAEVAGPREEQLVEAAKRLVASRGDDVRIEGGAEEPGDTEGIVAAGGLLPGPLAKRVGPTFDEWLNAEKET